MGESGGCSPLDILGSSSVEDEMGGVVALMTVSGEGDFIGDGDFPGDDGETEPLLEGDFLGDIDGETEPGDFLGDIDGETEPLLGGDFLGDIDGEADLLLPLLCATSLLVEGGRLLLGDR